MGLTKRTYTDNVTVITAQNLNDIQDAIIELESSIVTDDLKQALLQIAQKVAYIDDQGQTYYDDLYNALYPPKTVVSITAVFEQGSTVIYDDTALNDLKQYLTVTARYDDNTTAILPDASYTLSGTLEAPSSTVTVLYSRVSTTFSVAVTARPTLSSITAVYTQSGTVYDTDTLDSLKPDLVVTAHYSDSSTQTVPAADYTLSGTLAAGTSTITVSYGEKTTTFDVTVTHYDPVREVGYLAGESWARASVPSYMDYVKISQTAARGRSNQPIANNNYTFTVTDSSKYNLAVYGITSLEQIELTGSGGVKVMAYPGVDNGVSWSTSMSRTTPYVAISLKKMDGTEFTSAELANGAAAVFTYTEGA